MRTALPLLSLVAAAVLLGGCVTLHSESVPVAPPTCATGDLQACDREAQQALVRGDQALAIADFARACDGGLLSACLSEGGVLTGAGELDAAEAPLLRAQGLETTDSRFALADLYEARRAPGDLQRASVLRREGYAVEQPDTEVIASTRLTVPDLASRAGPGFATALAFNVQPMDFYGRRLAIGAIAVLNPTNAELQLYAGYQHFFSQSLVAYGHFSAGVVELGPKVFSGDLGAELGLKLTLGPVGHLAIAAGSSLGTPAYVSVGVGVDGIVALLLLH